MDFVEWLREERNIYVYDKLDVTEKLSLHEADKLWEQWRKEEKDES